MQNAALGDNKAGMQKHGEKCRDCSVKSRLECLNDNNSSNALHNSVDDPSTLTRALEEVMVDRAHPMHERPYD